MADHDVLLEVLRRFARTMSSTDYDITDVLYELGDSVREVLETAGAGIALFDEEGDLRFVTATSEPVVVLERAQERFQSGPCMTSTDENRPVVVNDLHDEDRWPDYRVVADEVGMRAVLGLPLVLDGDRVGALNVYDTAPRDWTEDQVQTAVVLADIAASYVLNASELARSRRTAEQLQRALDSRVIIEQAKGRLSGDLGIGVDEAFTRLRDHARNNNRTVRDLAEQIVARGSSVIDA